MCEYGTCSVNLAVVNREENVVNLALNVKLMSLSILAQSSSNRH